MLFFPGYISQTMKMGSTIANYRTFALEELKNATNDFDASGLISGFLNCQVILYTWEFIPVNLNYKRVIVKLLAVWFFAIRCIKPH